MTAKHPAPAGVGACVGGSAVSARLGVSLRTVERWSDDGTIPVAYRTPGGHRRFRLVDVAALERRLAASTPPTPKEP